MFFGPTLITDKSTLQSLNVDEAVWLDTFYRASITPLFFVETLADLDKEVALGRTPEQVVGNLADKAPTRGGLPNVHHNTLAVAELLGYPVTMRGVPVVGRGEAVAVGDRRGVRFQQAPEVDAFQRWQEGQFLEVERRFAKLWRQGLAALDLDGIYQTFHRKDQNLKSLADAKAVAELTLRRDGWRLATLRLAMATVGVPPVMRPAVVGRWKSCGGPHLRRERKSNKIDLAYLYYLPFCQVFASSDNLHRRAVPCFLRPDQVFVDGRDLKVDLAKLDVHYSKLPAEIRVRGVIEFAVHPPVDGEFLTAQLWDRFLPAWRQRLVRDRPPRSKEKDAELLAHLDEMTNAERVVSPSTRPMAEEAGGK